MIGKAYVAVQGTQPMSRVQPRAAHSGAHFLHACKPDGLLVMISLRTFLTNVPYRYREAKLLRKGRTG